MTIVKNVVELIFGIALFANALLFLPQIICIIKEKSAKSVSLLTFLGFLLIQLAIILHALIIADYLLLLGYSLSVITCGSVVGLILWYRKYPGSIADTQNECSLEKRIEFLENLIASMPGHVYWLDKNNVYLGCNDNQARSAGLSSRYEVVGKRNKDFPWNEKYPMLAAELERVNQLVMETGIENVLEEPGTLLNGSNRLYLSNKVPLRDKENNIIGLVGISVDITKSIDILKAAKEAAEIASKAKEEFLKNMRHDLRTPFSGVLGLSELLMMQETDAAKKENLHYIVQSAKQLLDYLNEILEFCETEAGQLPILEKSFDLSALIHGITQMMLPSAKSKHVQFNCNCTPDIPHRIIGDQVRTQRILINLLSNAIKFTHHGKVDLSVSVFKCEEYRIVIKFVVQDTGIGISEDQQGLLFEQFNRLTSSYSGVYSGKGLGLRMVKHLLDEIHGEIEVQSVENKGSTFTVLIPYKLGVAK